MAGLQLTHIIESSVGQDRLNLPFEIENARINFIYTGNLL